MKIPPIPRVLLIHSIEYAAAAPDTRYAGAFGEPVRIDFVRVEPSRKLVTTSTGESKTAAAELFVCTAQSAAQPAGTPLPSFAEGDQVTFNGRAMRIIKADPLYALDPVTPHHYEIMLE